MLHLVNSIRLLKLPCFHEGNGDLIVMEGLKDVPFNIARVFVVRAAATGDMRGQHAHKICTQFLFCSAGCIEVLCYDGIDTMTFILDSPEMGLLIPPGIWSQQTYKSSDSSLVVLCDRPYEERDYIREYSQYKKFRQTDNLDDYNREMV